MPSVDSFHPVTTQQKLPLPLNGTIYTTTRTVAAEKPKPTIGSTMEAELGSSWADSKIIAVQDTPKNGKTVLTITHARIPSEADQLASNWERQLVNVGIGQFEGVVRTVIIPAESYVDNTPALNSAMPVVNSGLFQGDGYVLYRRDVVKSGSSLEPVFRVERRTFIRKVSQRQQDFDAEFGTNLSTVQTLYFGTENVPGVSPSITVAALFTNETHSYWGLQSDGHAREGQQLTPDWYAITVRQVIPSGFVSNGRTYTTVENYLWPAVLADPGYQLDSWPRREGGEDMHVRPIYSKEEYRGPCKAVVVETFSVTPPTVSTPNVMMPLPIHISTPFFSLNVGPCLHKAISLPITSGTNHPIYEYAGGSFDFVDTTPTTWPESILASDDVRPFRGGYLRSQVTVYPPSYA